jgi:acetylornithine/succinyldiaminopimelate/putrescine aminotransferase
MQGLVVPGRAAELVRELHGRRLLSATATGDVLRLLPPYIVTPTEVDDALTILEGGLAAIEA